MARKLFRVQDGEGRGPYRPGFSQHWSDLDGPILRPWWTELGISIAAAHARMPTGMFSGCAFASLNQLAAWFSAVERRKLDDFGFHVVRFRPDRIVAETPTQVVFAQSYPLAGLPVFGRLTCPSYDTDGKRPELSAAAAPDLVSLHDQEVAR